MTREYKCSVSVCGVVQGVGFRPFVYRLATSLGLTGSVQNTSGAVSIVLEGAKTAIDNFLERLVSDAPEGSRIDQLTDPIWIELERRSKLSFEIVESENSGSYTISFPADLGMCEECLAEVSDPANRRYGYAFTTCTACGPRYTVVQAMPYDRSRTTLSIFPLCAQCQREYDDPNSRRFHAESIACPECGPRLLLVDASGKVVSGADPVRDARRRLRAGEIVAVRGIGGFALAADATNCQTLKTLRDRKRRPAKPFAVMVRNQDVLRRMCSVSSESLEMLRSSAAPIVICETTVAGRSSLAFDDISPETTTLGVMLPTAPLHLLLFSPLSGDPVEAFDALVMTSGNRRSEPICISNEEALERLSGIADCYLIHDRAINLRADDSVLRDMGGPPQIWRRARGFVPNSLPLPCVLPSTVLACGAYFKNTVALGFDSSAVLSPHIGDLETLEARLGFERVISELPQFFEKKVERVACDLHPDIHSSIVARDLAQRLGVPLVQVQHHAAHAASCLVEHGRSAGLALVFDGTGYGSDGALWGAELLFVDGPRWRRLGTFAPSPLPGGEAAIVKPWRQLVARILALHGKLSSEQQIWDEKEVRLCEWQLKSATNCPNTHSAGRLFDCISAALGFAPERVSYEGQAAVRLEAEAARAVPGRVCPEQWFKVQSSNDLLSVDWSPGIDYVSGSGVFGSRRGDVAVAFHVALAQAALAMAKYGREVTGAKSICLTGGCFMNLLLSNATQELVRDAGMEVLVHRVVPPNDGGISLGQVFLGGE